MGSIVEDDLEEAGDCEERSNRSMCKGLFLNFQVVFCLVAGWSVYLYDYE